MSKNLTKAWTFLLRYEWAPVIKLLGRFNGENGKEIKQKVVANQLLKYLTCQVRTSPNIIFLATNHRRPLCSIYMANNKSQIR